MPRQQTLEQAQAYWAERLGCAIEDVRRPGVTPLPNGGELATYRGAFLLRWDDACVFTTPVSLFPMVETAIRNRTLGDIFDGEFLASLFAPHVGRIVGPAFQACADASDFRPVDTRGTRLLTANDIEALRRLTSACAPDEWADITIESNRLPVFGCFACDELASAGTLIAWGQCLRNIGIVTHPTYRGLSYGRAVVSEMTAYTLGRGNVAQYQTLLGNASSVALAHALGYQQYATTFAVRLRDLPEEQSGECA
ncbi:MAG: hypothetical protein ABI068_07575 [Ktedonobacterales bacterium]